MYGGKRRVIERVKRKGSLLTWNSIRPYAGPGRGVNVVQSLYQRHYGFIQVRTADGSKT